MPNRQSTAGSRNTAALIGIALAMGVVAFAAVAIFLRTSGAVQAAEPDATRVLYYASLWLLAISLIPALYLQRSAAGFTEHAAARGEPVDEAALRKNVLNRLVIAWALLEAPALLAIVVYLLSGRTLPMYVALPVFLGFLALTHPRAHWFAATPP